MCEAMICKPRTGVEDPQKIEKLIDEAVTETGRQRTAKKGPKRG